MHTLHVLQRLLAGRFEENAASALIHNLSGQHESDIHRCTTNFVLVEGQRAGVPQLQPAAFAATASAVWHYRYFRPVTGSLEEITVSLRLANTLKNPPVNLQTCVTSGSSSAHHS